MKIHLFLDHTALLVNDGSSVLTVEPDCEYTEMVRLVADDGKALTKDGENFTACTDVVSADGWYEVDAPEEETEAINREE